MSDMPDEYEEDPELVLRRMKAGALKTAEGMIPLLLDKAVNGKTKDALAIFEALADRSGFHSTAPVASQQSPVQILNIAGPDIAKLLGGLKTITEPVKEDKEGVTE
jgi:hypothetical protein